MRTRREAGCARDAKADGGANASALRCADDISWQLPGVVEAEGYKRGANGVGERRCAARARRRRPVRRSRLNACFDAPHSASLAAYLDSTPGNTGDAGGNYTVRAALTRRARSGLQHLPLRLRPRAGSAAQDDVDVYRGFLNMPPGGFYVGNTTGWLARTDSEFLRRVGARGLQPVRFCSADTQRAAAQVLRQHHAVGVLLFIGQVSAA